jgi:hypothetical protein
MAAAAVKRISKWFYLVEAVAHWRAQSEIRSRGERATECRTLNPAQICLPKIFSQASRTQSQQDSLWLQIPWVRALSICFVYSPPRDDNATQELCPSIRSILATSRRLVTRMIFPLFSVRFSDFIAIFTTNY